MTGSSKIISFPPTGAVEWIESYVKEALGKHDESTVEVYQRILRHFTTWVVEVPGHEKRFMPTQLTKPSIELYLSHLRDQGYSVSHRGRVKSVLSGFCQWLMEEKEAIGRNPTRGIKVPTQQILAPRVLEPDQRFENAGGQNLLSWHLDTTSGIAADGLFLLHEPLAEATQD